MKIIGARPYQACITGGIGSGKSTASEIFQEMGIPIFNSDKVARECESIPEVINTFNKIAGEDVYVDGIINRDMFREIIFSDNKKLEQINKLVLPYVSEKYNEFLIEHIEEDYVMLESALIFEFNIEKNFDHVICVTADMDTRYDRVLKRDNVNSVMITKKMKSQLEEEVKLLKANSIIFNSGELSTLKKQVETIDKAIRYEIIWLR